MWNKNEAAGQFDQAKGKIKQALGDLTGNETLKHEGAVDEAVGKVTTAVGGVQKQAHAAIDIVGRPARS
jgi:uncharacterized protein YjbJ (UPF0337 family)